MANINIDSSKMAVRVADVVIDDVEDMEILRDALNESIEENKKLQKMHERRMELEQMLMDYIKDYGDVVFTLAKVSDEETGAVEVRNFRIFEDEDVFIQ